MDWHRGSHLSFQPEDAIIIITEIFLAALAFGFLIIFQVQMTDLNGREESFQSANWCLGPKENWCVVGNKFTGMVFLLRL